MARRGGARHGHGRAQELVGWANAAVDAGWSTRSFFSLAGEIAPFYSSEIGEAFIEVLDELELPEPPSFESLWMAELFVLSRGIADAEISERDGLDLIAQLVIDSGHSSRLGAWIDLVEDAAILAFDHGLYLIPGLSLENLPEHA